MSTNGRQILLVRQVQDHCKYALEIKPEPTCMESAGSFKVQVGRLLHLRAPKAPNLVTAGALQLRPSDLQGWIHSRTHYNRNLGTLFITGGTTHLRSV